MSRGKGEKKDNQVWSTQYPSLVIQKTDENNT